MVEQYPILATSGQATATDPVVKTVVEGLAERFSMTGRERIALEHVVTCFYSKDEGAGEGADAPRRDSSTVAAQELVPDDSTNPPDTVTRPVARTIGYMLTSMAES